MQVCVRYVGLTAWSRRPQHRTASYTSWSNLPEEYRSIREMVRCVVRLGTKWTEHTRTRRLNTTCIHPM